MSALPQPTRLASNPREVCNQIIEATDYVMLSPDGSVLKVTAQVFEALAMFLGVNRKHEAGNLQISCRNGGVAGVEVNVKLK